MLADVRDALDPPLPLTAEIHEAGLALASDHGVAFYDALIVAAACDAGCATLYSENLQHGRRFSDLVVENPFLGILSVEASNIARHFVKSLIDYAPVSGNVR